MSSSPRQLISLVGYGGFAVVLVTGSAIAVQLIALVFGRRAGGITLLALVALAVGSIAMTVIYVAGYEPRVRGGDARRAGLTILTVASAALTLGLAAVALADAPTGTLRFSLVVGPAAVIALARPTGAWLGSTLGFAPMDAAPGMREGTRARVGAALPWLFVLGALTNVVVLDLLVPRSGAPLISKDSGDLSAIVRSSPSSTRQRNQLYVDMYDIAAGGVLIIPEEPLLDRHLVRALARMTVEVRTYDPEINPGLFGIWEPPNGQVRTREGILDYWIVPGPPSPGLWMGRFDLGILIVPESVMPSPGSGS